ncbi:hypothetical protein [Aquipuribacter nitratireducens]|uniref:Uncharacterized protein n=1 Tax=Aquipuribacter nitratireducens TaxID=650104 RepID=A0ABW0GTA9_9MICO
MRALEEVAEGTDADGVEHPSHVRQAATTQAAQDAAERALQDLAAAGYLDRRINPGLNDDVWVISAVGHAALRERQSLRNDLRRRNTACRRAVLGWLYDAKHDDRPSSEGDWKHFGEAEGNVWVGRPFSEKALAAASRSLFEDGLIKGISSAGHERIERPEITSQGEAWLDRQDAPAGAAPGGGAIYNIGGNAVVNSVDRSPGSTNTQHGSISEDSRRVLLQHLDGLDQVLDVAPLTDEHAQQEAVDAARALRAEADAPAPDRGQLSALVARLRDATTSGVGTAAGSAAVSAVVAAVQTAVGAL